MLKFGLVCFLIMIIIVPVSSGAGAQSNDEVTRVICNVVVFVQKLGLPIMTGVILGSSIMAIFGRLPWPAIVMLVVFTAIFFGAGKLIAKFAKGVNGLQENFDCSTVSS
ncbi:MAG: TrbC/VirB2 family protein [Ehrlichia sp.]